MCRRSLNPVKAAFNFSPAYWQAINVEFMRLPVIYQTIAHSTHWQDKRTHTDTLTDNSSWAAHRQWPRSRTMWDSRSIWPSKRWSQLNHNARWNGTWAPDRRLRVCPEIHLLGHLVLMEAKATGNLQYKCDKKKHQVRTRMGITWQCNLVVQICSEHLIKNTPCTLKSYTTTIKNSTHARTK